VEELLRASGRVLDSSGLLSVSILMLEIGEIASLGFFGELAFTGCWDTLSIEAFFLDVLSLFDFALFSVFELFLG